MNFWSQTNYEAVQLNIDPEAICKIIDVPFDRVGIIYIELVVTNETVRLDYALGVSADLGARRNTESRLLSDSWSQIHFGNIQHAKKVARPNVGFGLSPDQTKPFHHSFGPIQVREAVRRDDYLVKTSKIPGSNTYLLHLVPNQRTLFNSWLLSRNRMVSSRLSGWSTSFFPAAIRENELASTNGSNGPETGKIERIAVQFFPDIFQNPENPDKRFYSTLVCISAIAIIASMGFSAYRE